MTTMRKILYLLVFSTFFLASMRASDTPLRVLYDPRVFTKHVGISQVILKNISKFFETNLGRFDKKSQIRNTDCPQNISLKSYQNTFTGSFTKRGIKQTGYIFSLCQEILVVALFENSRMFSLLAFASKREKDRCRFNDFYAVRDINRNELSEIAIVTTCDGAESASQFLSLLEFRKSSLSMLCYDKVGHGFSLPMIGDKPDYWEKIVYVNPQPKPLFVAQKAFLKKPSDGYSKQLVLSDQMTAFCDQKPKDDSFEISMVKI